MLDNWLTPDKIQMVESVTDWQAAVTLAAQPLLADATITAKYLSAIFDAHAALGPFYVLAPGLAMPHARPEQGALKNGLSLVHIRHGVAFHSAANDPIYVVLMLSAHNGDEHIAMISHLAGLFSDEQRLGQLLHPQNRAALMTLLQTQ